MLLNWDVTGYTGMLRGEFSSYQKGLSRFLKPQSGSERRDVTTVPPLQQNSEVLKQATRGGKNCAFNRGLAGPRCGLMVVSDYGFKNPAQVHLGYKVLFS